MKRNAKNKKTVIFDLWETLIFGAEDSAISRFYENVTNTKIAESALKSGMLIKESEPRPFLSQFLEIVESPSGLSSMLLSLKNPRSPLYERIVERFNEAVEEDFKEMRWVPGAIELLTKLKNHYSLVLVSNLWAYQKRYVLDRLNLAKYFDKCLFSCDLGINKNTILHDITRILGIEKKDALFVGRSYEYDIIPAVNANISAVRISGESNVIFPEKLAMQIQEELDGTMAEDIFYKKVDRKNKKECLIVIPPFYKLLGSHNNRLNLSASSISSSLSIMGYQSHVYHCDSEPHENYINRYQMMFNSISFYEAMEKENSYDEFASYYQSNAYEIVFVTCGDILNPSVDSGNWDSARKIAKIIRKINPSAYIIAIGPEILDTSEDFDLIIFGEVESLLPAIVKKEIRGRVTGMLLAEERLKSLPTYGFENIVTPVSPPSLDTVIWRRGCTGTCDFCRVAQINKGTIRYRTIDSVIEDIRLRYKRYGLKNFYIVDANFTVHRELVLSFCERLRKEFSDIQWRTESRFDTLNVELIREMKKAGCTHLKLGLENTLNEKHQVKTKRISLDYASECINTVQGNGIKCIIYLMLGGKWFTHDQYKQMYENAETLNADGYTVSLYNPYPNTPAGLSYEEWRMRRFTGSHLDIRLIDFWKIPIDIVDAFFSLELKKGREDRNVRNFDD